MSIAYKTPTGGNKSDSKMLQLDDRDMISNLPLDLIVCILERLSVHDAARTSVLSKEWRHPWAMNTRLFLDNLFFSQLTSNKDNDAHQSVFMRALEMIVLGHSSRIQRFFLYIPPKLDQCPVVRWNEHFLKKGIKDLGLDNSENNAYEIPSCLFDCVDLISLQLHTWILNAPHKCTSFTNLLRVRLRNISFKADISFGTQLRSLSLEHCTGIQHLASQFTNVNSLTHVILIGSEEIDWRWFECTSLLRSLDLKYTSYSNYNPKKPINMIKFLGNIPSIHAFYTSGFTLQVCRPGLTMINGLATKVENMKEIFLSWLGSYNLCQISIALYLIRCFPNLQRIGIGLVDDKSTNPIDSTSNLHSVDLKDTSLCQLHTVDIMGVMGSNYVFHLVKNLLASSPSLKVMSLLCSSKVTDPGEKLKIKQELQRFPKRSLAAKLLFRNFKSK